MTEWVKGKRVVITGPTSGIGRQTAIELGDRGAALVLGCRDRDKGEALAGVIAQRPGALRPDVMQVDTSNQRSIRAFARACRERYPSLDVLVNNAGTVRPERVLSVDGIELTFATNVIGYHLLSIELIDLLRSSAPSRIINVASLFASAPDFEDLQFHARPYNALEAYPQSKACNRLLTWALARRLEGSGVTVNAMSPGLVTHTGLIRDMSDELKHTYSQRVSRSMEQGADTVVWMASSADLERVSGALFYDRHEMPCQFRNVTTEERLWQICDRMIAASQALPS